MKIIECGQWTQFSSGHYEIVTGAVNLLCCTWETFIHKRGKLAGSKSHKSKEDLILPK